jgi:ribonuclease D
MSVSGRGPLTVVSGDLPAGLAAGFGGSAIVAWDIETSGLDWRSDVIGTCQIFAEGVGTAVISVAAGSVPERLAALLEDSAVVKVFHHAPFDLRFMSHAWGVEAASVRCTKVASKLLDPRAPNEMHSLQSLLARYLGVHLDKGPVRTSDWSASVLSAEQVEYAAGDVIHLPRLLQAMQDRLDARELSGLYDRCCEFLPSRVALELGDFPDVFAY